MSKFGAEQAAANNALQDGLMLRINQGSHRSFLVKSRGAEIAVRKSAEVSSRCEA
jgi:hypothetical protein